MSALTLGFVAALCWGFHDICIRFLSQKTPLSACMITVLSTGLIFHVLLMGTLGDFEAVSTVASYYAVGAGVFFVIATFGLYYAFERGPVRLVSPLIAAYPILSLFWAMANGTHIEILQWVAVLAVIAGVSIVAALSDTSDGNMPAMGPTIAFSLIAAVGFAGTFALGQEATQLSGHWSTTMITRVVSVVATAGILLTFRMTFWAGWPAIPWLIAMGIADGVALYCVLSVGGLSNAHYASVASSTFGMLTIILAWALLKERMSVFQWLGCGVAFAGVGYLAL